jgi:CHAT domain-containing protein
MPAKLVVLSACQTGLGRQLDAGIAGLARAFQLAGAARVVMSLWSVHDDSTAELMADFISRLREEPPAEALRLSMLQMRKTDRTRHTGRRSPFSARPGNAGLLSANDVIVKTQ